MSEPQGEETPRVVIRDKRRIDPTSGAVRAHRHTGPRRVRRHTGPRRVQRHTGPRRVQRKGSR